VKHARGFVRLIWEGRWIWWVGMMIYRVRSAGGVCGFCWGDSVGVQGLGRCLCRTWKGVLSAWLGIDA
jgi:hypothetical protein